VSEGGAGVDPSVQMKDGSRAFDWAIFGGSIEVMQLLEGNNRVDLHAQNHFGCGAAFWAAASGRVETCRSDSETNVSLHIKFVGFEGVCSPPRSKTLRLCVLVTLIFIWMAPCKLHRHRPPVNHDKGSGAAPKPNPQNPKF
jgi:ankyrin repeat protein